MEYKIDENPYKRRKLDPQPHSPPQQVHETHVNKKRPRYEEFHDQQKAQRTTKTSCRQEMIKRQNYIDYWSGRTQPIDKYDFLIISGMPNCIHRYIK